MAPIGLFFGGLILGPLFAAQAGLAWYLVVGVLRFFGHWVTAALPPLRWALWPLLRTGYVLLLVVLAAGYLSGSAGAPGERAQLLATVLGVAASFGGALFLRHRGWPGSGPADVPFRTSVPGAGPPSDPFVPNPTWAPPPDAPGPRPNP